MTEIVECRRRADFEEVARLLREMAEWDVAETSALGVPADDLIPLYYSDGVDALMAKFSGVSGSLRLARAGDRVLGCIAVFRIDDDLAEIRKLFVRPQARGMGIGRALLAGALQEICSRGFARVRLVTATFMTGAIAIYHEFGFVDCEPFYPSPDHLGPITLFMQRELGGDG